MGKKITTIAENKTLKAVNILLVEDNPADAKLIENLLMTCHFPVKLRVVQEGEEALKFLREPVFEGHEDPHLVLLDLNLPKMDGQAVLARIKGDRDLKHIPVIVLTSSNNPWDVKLARENHADDYLLKAADIKEFTILINRIEAFCLRLLDQKP